MTLRTRRERVLQTCAFEAGGLLLAAPAYAAVFGASAADSIRLIAALALACMLWSPLHNTLFDWVELRCAGRVASERPHRWRAVHALSHETTILVVTLPMVMALGGHDLRAALAIDIGLTLFYAGYAYAFHLGFDRLRPVKRQAARPRGARP